MKTKNKWAGKVIYQIYPRSFADATGDGVGDLKGVTSKLDYVADLGVDAIWLSPFYVSPMKDFGYDVSNYCAIDPLFGDMNDFHQLVEVAHSKGMQVLLDFIPNHTSDQHPWFHASRSSKHSPKRNWYVWRSPGPKGQVPNNWLSNFGGPAWEFDKTTSQYYLHSFLKEQPDLNWDNPEVRKMMHAVLKFWLDKGVDGFRLDAVYWISKDQLFRSDPIYPGPSITANPYDELIHVNSRGGPNLFKYLREMARVVSKYDGQVVVEAYPDVMYRETDWQYLQFYQKIGMDNTVPFNFQGMQVDWSASAYKHFLDSYQNAIGQEYVPVYAFSNHDSPRIVSRLNSEDKARALAAIQFTLPGATFVYYGDELGLENAAIRPSEVQDPVEKRQPNKGLGRDPSRAPMRWDAGRFAGFSLTKPWLPFGDKRRLKNVKAQLKDYSSMLWLYKDLIALRRSSDVLKYGHYRPVQMSSTDVYGFVREYEGQRIAVIVNFSSDSKAATRIKGKLLLSTFGSRTIGKLQPLEAQIIEL